MRPFVAPARDRDLTRARNQHAPAEPSDAIDSPSGDVGDQPTDLKPSTAYWRGASGRLYRHSAHTTVYCPAPQHGVYVLARRDQAGSIVPLFVGVAASPAGTLNLAHIRRRAVSIGATEVHLCPVAVKGSVFSLRRVARDLRRSFAQAA